MVIVGTQTVLGWTTMSLSGDYGWWLSHLDEDTAIEYATSGILRDGQQAFQVQRFWSDRLVESLMVYRDEIGRVVITPWHPHPHKSFWEIA